MQKLDRLGEVAKANPFMSEGLLDSFNDGFRYGEAWDDPDAPYGGFNNDEHAFQHWFSNLASDHPARSQYGDEQLKDAGHARVASCQHAFKLGYWVARANAGG